MTRGENFALLQKPTIAPTIAAPSVNTAPRTPHLFSIVKS